MGKIEKAQRTMKMKVGKSIQIAYILYVTYQNVPSTPRLGKVRLGFLKEDIKKMFEENFEGTDGELDKTDWGDVVMCDALGDSGLHITFEEEYKLQALKELGIK